MKKIKVITTPSFGLFEPSDILADKLKELNINNWGEIKARTNIDLINFVELFEIPCTLLDKDNQGYLEIIEVDIDRPWKINYYDGAESIFYLDKYTLVDKFLNFHEMSHN